MIKTEPFEFPEELQPVFKKAKWYEWVTIGYMASSIILLYFTMGGSQAMKAAWLEDILGLIPATAFLISSRFFNKSRNHQFPYAYHRVYTIAYLCGSFALFFMGLYLFYDSAVVLLKVERPTIGSTWLFGKQIWMGWIMMLALLYSGIPSVFIGRAKLPLANKLNDNSLYADAKMQKADWMTAAAAILGIIGIGLGFWWADSGAALFISLSIIKDGYSNVKSSISYLMDQAPRKIDNDEEDPVIAELEDMFEGLDWIKKAQVRLREAGNVYYGEAYVIPSKSISSEKLIQNIEDAFDQAFQLNWKIHDLSIEPVNELPKIDEPEDDD